MVSFSSTLSDCSIVPSISPSCSSLSCLRRRRVAVAGIRAPSRPHGPPSSPGPGERRLPETLVPKLFCLQGPEKCEQEDDRGLERDHPVGPVVDEADRDQDKRRAHPPGDERVLIAEHRRG